MVSSSENPNSTQRMLFMFDMYSANRAELYAEGSGCSKVSSPGLGLRPAIQSVRFDAGLNQAAWAIRFRCMTGHRLLRQSVISWGPRAEIASTSRGRGWRPWGG